MKVLPHKNFLRYCQLNRYKQPAPKQLPRYIQHQRKAIRRKSEYTCLMAFLGDVRTTSFVVVKAFSPPCNALAGKYTSASQFANSNCSKLPAKATLPLTVVVVPVCTTGVLPYSSTATQLPIFRILREGIILHTEEYDEYGTALANKSLYKDVVLHSFERESGLMLATDSNRGPSVSASVS